MIDFAKVKENTYRSSVTATFFASLEHCKQEYALLCVIYKVSNQIFIVLNCFNRHIWCLWSFFIAYIINFFNGFNDWYKIKTKPRAISSHRDLFNGENAGVIFILIYCSRNWINKIDYIQFSESFCQLGCIKFEWYYWISYWKLLLFLDFELKRFCFLLS